MPLVTLPKPSSGTHDYSHLWANPAAAAAAALSSSASAERPQHDSTQRRLSPALVLTRNKDARCLAANNLSLCGRRARAWAPRKRSARHLSHLPHPLQHAVANQRPQVQCRRLVLRIFPLLLHRCNGLLRCNDWQGLQCPHTQSTMRIAKHT